MSEKTITIGYWDCRARVGILSLLLDYCKISYNLRLYPHSKFDEWGAKYKDELGADFPNLPYLINGDKIVTESLAIIRYIVNLGGRQDLLGKNLDDQTLVDITLNVAKDVFDIVDLICYTKNDFETEKNKLFSTSKIKDKLTRFNKFLEGKEWICGYLTVADFYLFEDLDFIHDMDSSKLEPYPNLVNLRKRFLELPEVQAHRQTENFIPRWLPYEATWTNVPGHNEKKSQDKVIVGYMSGRVLGQITRHLIAYCKVPHEEKRYVNREDWEKEKEILGFDFPNLPYLIHGDLKLTESLAVYEYIPTITGHHELNGTDDSTKWQIKMLTGVVNDLKTEVHKLIFSTPKESFAEASEKSWAQGVLKDKLSRLNKYLGNKEYLCGNITVVDFVLFNLLDVLKELNEANLNEYLGLVGLYKRFAEIPQIKSFTEVGNDVKLWVPPVAENWVKKNE